MASRQRYYILIGQGAKRLGFADKQARRDWFHSLTGQAQLKDCTDSELLSVVVMLRLTHVLPVTNGTGKRVLAREPAKSNQTTEEGWAAVDALIERLGWSGREDPRFLAFLYHGQLPPISHFLSRNRLKSAEIRMRFWVERLERAERARRWTP
jgi:hypothetical protein